MRVLIAEDDTGIRDLLHDLIERQGHTVTVARDGEEAWGLFTEHGADVIVSDWLMPRVEGPELCRRVRDHDSPYAYFILLTALGDQQHHLTGRKSGADDYLAKPFAREELIARLRALLRRTGWDEDAGVLRVEDLELEPSAHEARRGGRLRELTRMRELRTLDLGYMGVTDAGLAPLGRVVAREGVHMAGGPELHCHRPSLPPTSASWSISALDGVRVRPFMDLSRLFP